MGSTDKAIITGFICRLCSKMNRFVIHIYGEEGERMGLADKINAYLPITISANDPLPKTVCLPCIDRLEAHHELMEQFTWARQRIAEAKAAESSQVTNNEVDQTEEISGNMRDISNHIRESNSNPIRNNALPVSDHSSSSTSRETE